MNFLLKADKNCWVQSLNCREELCYIWGVDLNQLIQKIPKPLLVGGILIISLILFVVNDPLRDECDVQASIFEKKMKGILTPVKTNGKVQFPKMSYWKDRCREGNSLGSCSDYLDGLKIMTRELKLMNDKCQIAYSQKNDDFSIYISHGLQIMALVAWGEKPPAGLADRLGWLNVGNMQTFCYLKRTFMLIGDEETFLALREKVYREFPDDWPNKLDSELKLPENRPRAYKTEVNPSGTLSFEQVYQRSIFSIKCDLYM